MKKTLSLAIGAITMLVGMETTAATPTGAYIVTASSLITLSTKLNTYETVLSLTVPAGDWLVASTAVVFNSSVNGIDIRCTVFNGIRPSLQTTTLAYTLSRAGAAIDNPMSLVGALHTTASSVFSLQCERIGGDNSVAKVDSGATLLVSKAPGAIKALER